MMITFKGHRPIAPVNAATEKLLPLKQPQFGSRSTDDFTQTEAVDAKREWAEWNSGGSKTKSNHASDARKDDYSRYTPANTIAPPATFHTLISPTTVRKLWDLGNTLEQYIENLGRRSLDINWIKDGRTVDQVPITVFDFETTGLSAYDRIIQIAATPTKAGTAGLTVDHDKEYYSLLHPGYIKKDGKEQMFPMNPSASAVHGIFPEDVANEQTMEELMKHLTTNVIKPRGLLLAYNAKFDVGKMNEAIDRWNGGPLKREFGYVKELDLALVLDPFVLIQRLHPYASMKKTLGNHFKIIMGNELENMHDAQADVEATIDVFKYIVKYMEKHYIPRQWGEAAEKVLKEKVLKPGEWNSLDRANKAAYIARFVRDNRAAFEKKFGPPESTALRPTDILRFQHGYMAYQDEGGNLPVFDFTLNILGMDSTKKWDGSDKFDNDIAREVRLERDTENRAYLLSRVKAHFPANVVTDVAQVLRPDLKPTAKAAKTFSATLGKRVIDEAGEKVLVQRIFDGNLPKPGTDNYEETKAELKAELHSAFEQIVKAEWKAPSDTGRADTRPIVAAVDSLVEQGMACAEALQKELGHRYFYSNVPLGNKAALIDPAVLKSVAKAGGKRTLGNPPAFSGNVAELPKPRTIAYA